MTTPVKDAIFHVVNTTCLLLFGLLCFYPMYYIMINSFSASGEIAKGVYFYPRGLTLASYRQFLQAPMIFQSVLISTARTVVGTILTVFCSTLLGYLVTKEALPCRKFIYRAVVITMYFNAGLIPWYILMKNLSLKNNFLLYILPGAVNAFFVILVKTYIESIPSSLEEAAAIDGAGVLTTFFHIILPVCIPVLACLCVFSAVGQWNAWADNLYLVSDKNLQTLQFLLYKSIQSNMAGAMRGVNSASAAASATQQISPSSLRLAMTFIIVFPIMLVYPLLQKYFVKGIMLGAIKG